MGGYTHVHAQLERMLAQLKGTEACLLFPTGFAANLAVLASLASSGSGDDEQLFILSDELNHASIVDGAALARRRTAARLLVYRHADLAHLAALLEAEVPPAARAVVVTDSLFSMDGDFADLAGLARLKRRRPFLLVRCWWSDAGGGAGPSAHAGMRQPQTPSKELQGGRREGGRGWRGRPSHELPPDSMPKLPTHAACSYPSPAA